MYEVEFNQQKKVLLSDSKAVRYARLFRLFFLKKVEVLTYCFNRLLFNLLT